MLKPQANRYRQLLDCSGLWSFKADPDDLGFEQKWFEGFDSEMEMAVPGSWNEQLQEYGMMNYSGGAWLQRRVIVPTHFSGQRITLRVGSADYQAKAWINGQLVVENDILCLPFEAEVGSYITPGEEATITVWVKNELWAESISQAVTLEHYLDENRYRDELYPAVRYDFFPFGGIHRPVYLTSSHTQYIDDLTITTALGDNNGGEVHIDAALNCDDGATLLLTLEGDGQSLQTETSIQQGQAKARIAISQCRYWSDKDPFLYKLTAELKLGNDIIDQYQQNVGVRTIEVRGSELLLNGEPVFLRGFGKHEDSPIHGKGLNLPQMVKDFGLMRWLHANSFRTSHYPYAEEILEYADKKGFLVISEIPSINLDFRKVNDKTLANHKQAIERQFARDKNHPCVIMWSLANEPGFLAEPEYHTESPPYWEAIFQHARSLDSTRPMTVANVLYIGREDPVFDYADVVAINRYYGWYQEPGQLDRAIKNFDEELEYLNKAHGKPILVSEFGADTIPGQHSTSDQMFTEEYQAKFIQMYCELIESKAYCIGEHVWNFADFRTSQHFRRVILNLKGVFTRTRDPKRAAFVLRDLWSKPYRKPGNN